MRLRALVISYLEDLLLKDDYKIIIFQDFPGSEMLAANPKLPRASIHALNDKSWLYLRENFKYCLGVNVMGGDIIEDYPDLGDVFINDVTEHGFQSPTDEKWRTPLGQAYLEYYRDEVPDTLRRLHA
ncbi:hypothetical protein M413DRAFT_282278 [Hebeloma cylindrosporum]|uniref:Uncharacterized protein n=1 Tax=Hebeloma cylindrosporum TaxID=76867 RepID=A0A0C2Y7B0_HEBCY|nr:hypothetical protein M413DRAFT_282278 [Hebeloma cylindrosporum h7]